MQQSTSSALQGAEIVLPHTTSPVAIGDRIGMVDILRGFALLGILLLNIDDFVGPESGFHDFPLGLAHPAFTGWHAALDQTLFVLKWTFFEGKMRALFSMLFGAGTVLLLERIAARNGEARAAEIFHRRNMWLLVLGLVHGTLIWQGDILTHYSIAALLLLYPLKNVAPQKLLIVGVSVWLIGGTAGTANFIDAPNQIAQQQLATDARSAMASGTPMSTAQKSALDAVNQEIAGQPKALSEALVQGHRGFAASVADNREDFLTGLWRGWTKGLVLDVLGAMITGMALFKIGFLSGHLRTRTYMTTAIVCYAVAIPLNLGSLWYSFHHGLSVISVLESVFYPYVVLQFLGALGAASMVILLVRADWMSFLTRSLASVGRMAVTNYLFTSILCRFVFSWGPWKLYGTLEYYQYFYAVGIVWLLNLVLSRLWLHFFAFGPVEWLWRSLTYWKFQPFRPTGAKMQPRS